MRVAIAIVLLTGILFQTTAKLAILIHFKANQEYIAKNLCVNRKKPKSCCKGSCQLKKQLKEEDKKENKGLPNGLKDKFELLATTLTENKKYNFHSTRLLSFFQYQNHYGYSPVHKVFHPPNHLS